jgi:hypothetical protein
MSLMGLWLGGGCEALFARFCALFVAFFRRSGAGGDSLTAGTIMRTSSCMEFALWRTSFIVRYWGIIVGRVGPISLWS